MCLCVSFCLSPSIFSLLPSLPLPLFFPVPKVSFDKLAAFKSHLLVFHNNNFSAHSFRDFNPRTDDLFLWAGDSTLWLKCKTPRAKPLTQQPERKSQEGAKIPQSPSKALWVIGKTPATPSLLKGSTISQQCQAEDQVRNLNLWGHTSYLPLSWAFNVKEKLPGGPRVS